ncbi:hypothetical protein Thimo_1398 [Thioflavicoccus mobilis 8321]|uniref:CHAT domain-containing protein n=1 Tax=Thioflavicoccus mobilis 8321 TaxID=765912 RepID=L0GWI8_9GAMM|nr:CHAT domain-containing protein [Thioflavicoccus mobilis]AGA90192.1 hypothetical protein Thimo_1398 [Thioflavicoccus mobilis 8321]
MQATIEHYGSDLLCRSPNTRPAELRLAGDAARPRLEDWAQRYERAVRRDDADALLAIGRELFDWLDATGWVSAWAAATGPRALEIRVADPAEPLAQALLDAPWELLANRAGHLADDAVQPLELARRIGPPGEPLAPPHADLQLLFMAAAPAGQQVLDFEAEEAAILEATARLPLHLVVEESGAADPLGERLDLDGPFETLHLSCHGTIDTERGPLLALEDAVGDLAAIAPGELVVRLGEPERTPLVFLSACRTAERPDDPGERFEPFARALIRAGVPSVLGWDGSVYDADAMAFAETFYGELAGRERIARAAALARLALRRATLADDPDPRGTRGRHWHLARLYLGPRGGGPLTAKDGDKRRPPGAAYEAQFLDAERGEVPVARRSEFVGRRRAAQAVLRAFRDGRRGVLIHGMGNLGKSSLAARIASRLTGHRTVVVFERYDPLTVLDRVVAALPPGARAAANAAWRDAVQANPAALAEALEELLVGPLDRDPILLIVDDMERILARPAPGQAATPVEPAHRAPLAAILTAFARAQTDSRLLVTSRYRFTLPDGQGGDLADGLVRVPLQPLEAGDRLKQLRAAARRTRVADLGADGLGLVERALDLAAGNPGLQATLTTPILRGELEAAAAALDAIAHFRRTGAPPAEVERLLADGAAGDQANAVLAFFRRMAFATYRDALTAGQAAMLRALCVFSVDLPIPRPGLEAAGAAAGVADPAAAIDRLLGLGLADDWGQLAGLDQAAANPLARPLVPAPDETLTQTIAAASAEPLAQSWRRPDGGFAQDARALELTRLALAAAVPDTEVLGQAAEAAARWLFADRHAAPAAFEQVVQPVLARLQALGGTPPHGLRLIACDCAERLGDSAALDEMLNRLQAEGDDPAEQAGAMLYVARRQQQLGATEAAAAAFEAAAQGFLAANQEREWAIARGGYADILQARGNLDEALRIRTEEQLPVYERLGDVRAKAVTQGKIADILQARGNLDEALRILTDEMLIAFERLGDVRSKAVTQGKIADILQARGNLDEALRIRTEEQLPVYERLGDVREKAVTQGQIADILQARGNLDEALRIRTEKQLPVYERLGDVRSKAVTQGKIADILQDRGNLDEALRIRTEEELPVYERLGDVRSKAFTQGYIADILQARGNLDEALRIRTEEELPVYERLGDVRSKAVTQGYIADILQARGNLDEALRIRTEEQLPVFERLGDVRSKAVTQGKIADILQARDNLDEALRIRTEEELPVYERLGDVREKAVTQGKIADILQARGNLDEALALHEERLATFERLGDIDGIAHVRFARARLRLERGEHETGGIQAIYDDLAASYEILRRLGRPDGIGAVGLLLAQVLTMGGHRDDALTVLDEAEAAFAKLGQTAAVEQVRALRGLIAER